ncbi:hypothetical protein [Anaerotignum sp.]|uniref:hypothetical protein n=1 Tax=Anaerotignum sp. TaxID=2039241 RepID=UPI0033306DF7
MTRFLNAKLKKYKKAQFDKQQYIANFFLDENDNALVRIHLKNVESAFSPFCIKDHEELDGSFTDYLDNVIYHIPLKYSVILDVQIEQVNSEEKEILVQAIKNHYGLVLEDKKQDLKINLITIIGLLIVGATLLAFSYYLSSNNKGQLFTDFINIAGTFSLWEMVDLYLLDRKAKEIQKFNAAQLATADIRFT